MQTLIEERLHQARARVDQVIDHLAKHTDFSVPELRSFTEAELQFYRLHTLAGARRELCTALETFLNEQGTPMPESEPDTLRSEDLAIARTMAA